MDYWKEAEKFNEKSKEITYNGIKKELYVDRYLKEENKAISIEL